MNIAQILTLPDGVSGLDCSGIATYVQNAENKVGDHNGKPYDFWTQFVVLKDATGEIGVNLNLGSESYLAVAKGKRIAVEKGTVSSYTKDGKLRKSLRASLVVAGEPLQGQPAPQQSPQGTPRGGAGQSDHPDATRTSIERQTAIKAACERYAGDKDTTDYGVLIFAYKIAHFIATGDVPVDHTEADKLAEGLGESPPDEQREAGEDNPNPENIPY